MENYKNHHWIASGSYDPPDGLSLCAEERGVMSRPETSVKTDLDNLCGQFWWSRYLYSKNEGILNKLIVITAVLRLQLQ